MYIDNDNLRITMTDPEYIKVHINDDSPRVTALDSKAINVNLTKS